MSFTQRSAALYMSTLPESAFNTPYTAGADFIRVTTQNPVVQIPALEKRPNTGRGGSPFASAQCNGYWLPPAISLQDEANFESAIRLSLRGVGGPVTDAVVEAAIAWSHTASMLAPSSGLQLPSTTIVDVIAGSGADYLYPGCVVDSMTMSQEAGQVVQMGFQLLGSGKHRSPNAVTGSLPAIPAFSCAQTTGKMQYTDPGGLVDLAAGSCRLRSWSIAMANNHNPTNDRCIVDPKQIVNAYATTTGASASPYLQKLDHGDQTVTASITLELAATLAEQVQMAENIALTNITFGAIGGTLGAQTYELKWIIPSANFIPFTQQESNGKATVTLNFQALTAGTSILTVVGINGTATAS